ncbi:MAG: hypothetical protein ACRCUY_08835, partial [Thermoguttaceae bacterium]
MNKFLFSMFLIFCLMCTSVLAQPRSARIGYIYPGGGERGTTVSVMIVGRQIANASEVLVSSSGVHGRIVHGYNSMFINNGEDRIVARQIYNDVKKAVESGTPFQLGPGEKVDPKSGADLPTPESVVKRFPYFDLLIKEPNNANLQLVYMEYFAAGINRRTVDALNQGVLVEFVIAPDAELGDRDVRLVTSAGITPPFRFQISGFKEVREIEPNETIANPSFDAGDRRQQFVPQQCLQLEPQAFPVVINGQIRTADVDQFSFHAKKGERLNIHVAARSLVPYLPDGVPGWFQALVTLFGPDGQKIASSASNQFRQDPILFVDVPS